MTSVGAGAVGVLKWAAEVGCQVVLRIQARWVVVHSLKITNCEESLKQFGNTIVSSANINFHRILVKDKTFPELDTDHCVHWSNVAEGEAGG